jgi:hypothetical protein
VARRQVKSPTDIADLLLLEMSHLDQEHLRTVLLQRATIFSRAIMMVPYISVIITLD